MPIIKISAEDIQKQQPIPRGWYPAKLVKFDVEPNSKQDGINYIPTLAVEVPGQVEPRELKVYFSSKLPVMMIPFYEAVCGTRVDKNADLEIDTDNIVLGTKVLVEVIQEPFNGRMTNKMNNFLPGDAQPPF